MTSLNEATISWLQTNRKEVITMAKRGLTPGTPTSNSSIYEQVGPRCGKTNEQADSTRGKPLPPTEKPGMTWTLVDPAHHKGGK